ncbi:MAG: putative glycolipid-binding domain-containing protein [Actinomycetota bacterium]|nr:putative glycolipid-binding domain-containing protein [Actinomycetota bacterium]
MLLLWRGLDGFGAEACELDLQDDRLRARGTQLGADPVAYRLDYELETARGFATARLRAESRGGGWRRRLELCRDADGLWSFDAESDGEVELPPIGADLEGFGEAVDCDLGRSPVTNTLPVLRAGLLEPGAAPRDFVMAWVSVPDLAVHRSEQRYEPVSSGAGGHIVRYVGRHRDFVGELRFDRQGVVLHYPELAELVGRS